MERRLRLQALLEELLESRNVYFQAPPNTGMQYPCILYILAAGQNVFADNKTYYHERRYDLTVIDEDPDSWIVDKVTLLPKCTFSRFYVADQLNHFVFNLFF